MIFTPTPLSGVFVIAPEPIADERGFFARTWCTEAFARQGLDGRLHQCSISFNHRRGTLRGMHYQAAPHGEAKLVRVTQGAVYDVVVDLRADSSTYLQWFAAELTAANRSALYIPEGCAHGFQTLADDSEVLYQISAAFYPEAARGVRWNDPAFAIDWPQSVTCISERDAHYPDFAS